MSKAQRSVSVQGQTLAAVRKTQDAVVEAVTASTETANKILGYARFTKPFPADRGHRFQLRLPSRS